MAEWRPVLGYEGNYEVSDQGEVRSFLKVRNLPVPRPHQANPNTSGYLILRLSRNGKATTRLVHHLVLEAFCGLRPDGHEGRHLNGDKTNNALSNLEWSNHSDNMRDRSRHGTHASRNTGKTVCDHGHALTPDNVYTAPNGWRQCRICRRRAQRDSYQRRHAAQPA